MRGKYLALIIGALTFSICLLGLCQAATVVDTGPGPSSGNPLFLDSIHRGIAAKFTTSQTFKILNVDAWMQIDAAGPAKAVIYRNDAGGGVPGTIMFSQTFTAAVNPNAAWVGATGLNWVLPPGTYWVGFELDSPAQIMALLYYPAPRPLGAYATNIYGESWSSISGFDLGFRIQSVSQTISSVEPLLLN
jgi:hypothetical protein